jgi:hypothetical protein
MRARQGGAFLEGGHVGILRRNSSFLTALALIVTAGALIFGGVLAVRVAAAGNTTAAKAAAVPKSNNKASSYGLDSQGTNASAYAAATAGSKPLTLTPTDETPKFITERLDEERGIVLLVYCDGAADDMEMLSYFNAVKAQYAADTSFFSFDTLESGELGDTLDQLRVSNPPVLAIIEGNGEVSELYTGWIGQKVMEQRVADAVRGL